MVDLNDQIENETLKYFNNVKSSQVFLEELNALDDKITRLESEYSIQPKQQDNQETTWEIAPSISETFLSDFITFSPLKLDMKDFKIIIPRLLISHSNAIYCKNGAVNINAIIKLFDHVISMFSIEKPMLLDDEFFESRRNKIQLYSQRIETVKNDIKQVDLEVSEIKEKCNAIWDGIKARIGTENVLYRNTWETFADDDIVDALCNDTERNSNYEPCIDYETDQFKNVLNQEIMECEDSLLNVQPAEDLMDEEMPSFFDEIDNDENFPVYMTPKVMRKLEYMTPRRSKCLISRTPLVPRRN